MLSGTGGTFRRGINKLQKQAKRSTFGVLWHLRKLAHGRLPVETLCHTFRTLILPIMTYAAEVWTYDVGIAYKKMMTAIQMKFLKYALGVGQSTPNVAVLLELGEYPVEMFLHEDEGHRLVAQDLQYRPHSTEKGITYPPKGTDTLVPSPQ